MVFYDRLREWAAKAADREKDKQEKRRERRARMLAPKKFKEVDKEYELQQQRIADDLDDAFEQGEFLHQLYFYAVSMCVSMYLSNILYQRRRSGLKTGGRGSGFRNWGFVSSKSSTCGGT